MKDNMYNKPNILEFAVNLVVNAFILVFATKVFNGFYISNIWYALLASLIISILNETVKPLLVLVFLPITIYSLGFFYPIINVIVLKLTGLLLGNNFIILGWVIPVFISIFIWIMKLLCNIFIINPVMSKRG